MTVNGNLKRDRACPLAGLRSRRSFQRAGVRDIVAPVRQYCRGALAIGMSGDADEFAPTTADYGLLALPLDRAAAAYADLFAAASVPLDRREVGGDAGDVFAELEPVSMAVDRALLVAHGPGWTSYFANGLLGSDPFLPVSRIAAARGRTGLRIVRRPDATILEVYEGPDRGGDATHHRRTIFAARDGRWRFGSTGTPFPFEDTRRYAARRVRDRFTPDHLDALLTGLGAPPSPLPDAPRLTGTLFVQRGKAPQLPRWSYAEVRAGVPWRRDPGGPGARD